MPAPTEPSPTWATAATAEITEPTDPVKEQGYVDGYPASHEWVNWFWNLVGSWLAWMSAGGQNHYSTPDAAYADLDDGETAWVWEREEGVQGEDHTLAVAPAAAIQDMDVDGVYVYYALTTAGYQRDRTLPGSVSATYTPTNAGTVVAIATDGDSVALAYGNYVECYEIDGTSRWVYDHSASVQDVAFAGGDVVFVGTSDAANSWTNLNRLAKATGSNVSPGWIKDFYSSGAGTLYSVCVAGGRVIAAGDVNPSAKNIVSYDISSSAEIATAATATDVSMGRCVACDGVMVYVGVQADTYLEILNLTALTAFDTLTSVGVACFAVAVDQDHTYMALEAAGNGWVGAITKDTLSPIYKTDSLTADYPTAVASDGSALFYGQTADGGGTVHRVYRGRNRAELWRRTDHSDSTVTPWARAIYPIRER